MCDSSYDEATSIVDPLSAVIENSNFDVNNEDLHFSMTEVAKDSNSEPSGPNPAILPQLNLETYELSNAPNRSFSESLLDDDENSGGKSPVNLDCSQTVSEKKQDIGNSETGVGETKEITCEFTDSDDSETYVVLDEIDSDDSDDRPSDASKKHLSPKKRKLNRTDSRAAKRSAMEVNDDVSPTVDWSSAVVENDQKPSGDKKALEEEINEMDSEIGLLLEEMDTDGASDEDIEAIDKALEGMSSEFDDEKLPDSQRLSKFKTLGLSDDDENTFSDSDGMDSVIKDLCKEEEEQLMLSKQVDSIIDEMSDDEDIDRSSNFGDKISSDGGSIKDGIDLESVIEAINDDDEEICSRVDSIMKNKEVEDESEAIHVIDAISEEDEKEGNMNLSDLSDRSALQHGNIQINTVEGKCGEHIVPEGNGIKIIDCVGNETCTPEDKICVLSEKSAISFKDSMEEFAPSSMHKSIPLSNTNAEENNTKEHEKDAVAENHEKAITVELENLFGHNTTASEISGQCTKEIMCLDECHKEATSKRTGENVLSEEAMNVDFLGNCDALGTKAQSVSTHAVDEEHDDVAQSSEVENCINVAQAISDIDELSCQKEQSTENSSPQQEVQQVVNVLINVIALQDEGNVITPQEHDFKLSQNLSCTAKIGVETTLVSGNRFNDRKSPSEKRPTEVVDDRKAKRARLNDVAGAVLFADNSCDNNEEMFEDGISQDSIGLVISDIANGSALESDDTSTDKNVAVAEVCSTDVSLDMEVGDDKNNEVENSLLISNVQTCMEVEEDTKTAEGSDSCETEEPASLVVTSQESSCDSDKLFSNTLIIEDNLQDIINRLASPRPGEDDLKMPSSKSSDFNMSSKEDSQESKSNSKLTNGLESEVNSEPQMSSKTKDMPFIDNNLHDDKTDSVNVAENSTSAPLPKTNGISRNMVLYKMPQEINSSNEDKFIELQDYEMFLEVHNRVHSLCTNKYTDVLDAAQKKVGNLKKQLQDCSNYSGQIRVQMRDLASKQNGLFRNWSFFPKIERRTVGVNVRIVQQPDNKPKTYSNVTDYSKSSGFGTQQPTGSSPGPKSLPNFPSFPTSRSNSILGSMLQAPMTNHVNSSITMAPVSSSSGVGPKAVQIPAGRTAAQLPSGISLPASTTLLLPNNSVAQSSGHQVVDLTDDDSPRHPNITITTSATNLISTAHAHTTFRGQPKLGTPQNPFPQSIVSSLSSMVQLLPHGTTVVNAASDGNTVRLVRSSTTTSHPPRLAYIPSGSLPVIQQIGSSTPRLGVSITPQQHGVFANTRSPTFMLSSGNAPGNSIVARSVAPTANTALTAVSTSSSLPLSSSQLTLTPCFNKHPAPLPAPPLYPPNPKYKALPPKPSLKMNKVSSGIVLSWNMSLTSKHADIATYQLFAYQESRDPVSQHLWKKVGDIKALPLPMACTLTQFNGFNYHFAVRAVDVHKRFGPFSDPSSIPDPKGQ